MVEKWIRWISLINGRFKLNFDNLKIDNTSTLGWVIVYSNGTIEMVVSKYIGNASMIIVEYIALRCDTLVVKNNGF